MQDHVTSAASEIAQAANAKASVVVVNSTVASGVVISGRPEVVEAVQSVQLGSFLATTPVPWLPFLSWLEIMQAIGSLYLVYQFSISVYDRFISKFFRGNKHGQ